MPYTSNKKGFTLVEVVVVLVILGIVSAFTVPAVTGYIDNAKEKQAVSETQACVMSATTLAAKERAKAESEAVSLSITDINSNFKQKFEDWGGDLTQPAVTVQNGELALTEGGGQYYLLSDSDAPNSEYAPFSTRSSIKTSADVSGTVNTAQFNIDGKVLYLCYTSADNITVAYTSSDSSVSTLSDIEVASIPETEEPNVQPSNPDPVNPNPNPGNTDTDENGNDTDDKPASTPEGTKIIHMEDLAGNSLPAGAVYDIYCAKCGQKVGTVTTNGNGDIYLAIEYDSTSTTDAPKNCGNHSDGKIYGDQWGSIYYDIYETTAPTGYQSIHWMRIAVDYDTNGNVEKINCANVNNGEQWVMSDDRMYVRVPRYPLLEIPLKIVGANGSLKSGQFVLYEGNGNDKKATKIAEITCNSDGTYTVYGRVFGENGDGTSEWVTKTVEKIVFYNNHYPYSKDKSTKDGVPADAFYFDCPKTYYLYEETTPEGYSSIGSNPNDYPIAISTNANNSNYEVVLGCNLYNSSTVSAVIAPNNSNSETVKYNTSYTVTVKYTQPACTVNIAKTDKSDNPITGGTFKISGTNGYSKEWTMAEESAVTPVNLQAGSYTLTEVTPPDGYGYAEPISFTVTQEEVNSGTVKTVTMEDPLIGSYTLTINSKYVEVNDRWTQSNAKDLDKNVTIKIIRLYDNGTEETVETLEGKKTLSVDNLPLGKYVLRETIDDKNYVAAEDKTIEIKEATNQSVNLVAIKGKKRSVTISTVSVSYSNADSSNDEDKTPLAGVTVTVKSRGHVEAEFTSTTATKELSLFEGDYTIEYTVPYGYRAQKGDGSQYGTIRVEVENRDENNNFEVLAIANPVTTITKVDASGNRVAGAKLVVINDSSKGNNNYYYSDWTTESDADKKLSLSAGWYTLKEESAPFGYEKAGDISFEVSDDEEKTVTMTDKALPTQKVNISAVYVLAKDEANKSNIACQHPLLGVTLELYSCDQSFNQYYGNTLLQTWISGQSAKSVNLPEGYYYVKAQNLPNDLTMETTSTFQVTESNGERNVVLIGVASENKYPVIIKKVDTSGNALSGATLKIAKEI